MPKSIEELQLRYPNSIPCIIETTLLKKKKYLVPRTMTIIDFMCIIRRNVKCGTDYALYLLIDQHIPLQTSTFDTLFDQHARNGLLHLQLIQEKTFGSHS